MERGTDSGFCDVSDPANLVVMSLIMHGSCITGEVQRQQQQQEQQRDGGAWHYWTTN
jgi:hypothetical protein